MACTINASITSTGLINSGDATGNLSLQSDGITGLSINNGGKVVLANTALSTASAGTLEYDGGELYFTPISTERGLISNMQYYRLNSPVVGTNGTGAQTVFGVGVTLSSNTIYQFQAVINLIKTAGTTSHSVSTRFGGTATLNNIVYNVAGADGNGTWGTSGSGGAYRGVAFNAATAVAVTGTGLIAATQGVWLTMTGTVSVNVGGTFIPQYSLSAAPGGAYSTQIGSHFLIYPVGAAGSNTSIGTWA